MTSVVTLNCFVHGDHPIHRGFTVAVQENCTISELKSLIKKTEKPRFDDVVPSSMDLWKLDIPLSELAQLDPDVDPCSLGEQLLPYSKVINVFSAVTEERVHVLVVLPVSRSSVSDSSESRGNIDFLPSFFPSLCLR